MSTTTYREQELYAACPLPPASVGEIRIQIRTAEGASKWLSITPDEFKAIEDVLLGVTA